MKHFKHVSAKRLTWMIVICAFLIFATTHQDIPRAQAFDWPAPINQHRTELDVSGFPEEESVPAETPGSTDKHESTGDEMLLVPAR